MKRKLVLTTLLMCMSHQPGFAEPAITMVEMRWQKIRNRKKRMKRTDNDVATEIMTAWRVPMGSMMTVME